MCKVKMKLHHPLHHQLHYCNSWKKEKCASHATNVVGMWFFCHVGIYAAVLNAQKLYIIVLSANVLLKRESKHLYVNLLSRENFNILFPVNDFSCDYAQWAEMMQHTVIAHILCMILYPFHYQCCILYDACVYI